VDAATVEIRFDCARGARSTGKARRIFHSGHAERGKLDYIHTFRCTDHEQ
jgi:hypothetical protein